MYNHKDTRAALNAHAVIRTTIHYPGGIRQEVKGYISRKDLAPVGSLLCQYWAHENGSADPEKDAEPLFYMFTNWRDTQPPVLTHKDARSGFFEQLTISPTLPAENPSGSEDWAEGQDWVKISLGYVY